MLEKQEPSSPRKATGSELAAERAVLLYYIRDNSLRNQLKFQMRQFVAIFFGTIIAFIIGLFLFGGFARLLEIINPEFEEGVFYDLLAGPIIGLILTLLFILVIKRRWSLSNKVWLWWFLGIIAIVILLVIALLNFFRHPHGTSNYRDGRKLIYLRTLQTALELYSNDHDGLFPPIGDRCERVSVLRPYLVNYLSEFSDSATDGSPYLISVSGSRKNYVLMNTLESRNSVWLQNDTDGRLLNCSCDDPNLCLVNF